MKYIDEFRQKKRCLEVGRAIEKVAPKGREITLMEVCGTHTQSFFRYGLKSLMPSNIRLLSGPGCPVCVSAQGYIDEAIGLARLDKVFIATFGDMMRVPGTDSSLEKEKTKGADVRVVYSTLEALNMAKEHPDKSVIFLGVGFETTAPTIAAAILSAKKQKLKNFFIFSSHKLIPPAMEALLEGGDLNLDGFLCPGHVSTVIGARPYEFIAKRYRIPCCVAGFEPLDMLEGIYLLVKQVVQEKAEVGNQYRRSVRYEGNLKAQEIMQEVFKVADCEWRGLGIIPKSGLKIRKRYSQFDAEVKFPNVKYQIDTKQEKTKGCICGLILKGTKIPLDCPLFAKLCNPENPVGACMVSSEGTCSAYYKYRS